MIRTLRTQLHAPTVLLPTMGALIVAAFACRASADGDVLIQTLDGAIVTGGVDDATQIGELGPRVHDGHFLSNFRSAEPGFFSFEFGNPSLPPGASSFPSLHDVNFNLLPITMEQASSNLYYWNGLDAGAPGYTLSDVSFGIPTGVAWGVIDANSAEFAVTGTGLVVSGGLVSRTSSDIDPFDGFDSGSIHKHLVFQLDDNDGNPGTSPTAGVYMTSWQIRSAGFAPSDPFLMIHRTSTLSDEALEIAADWAEANYDSLVAPVVKGNFDGDADVDGGDFLAWQRALGTAATPHGTGADGNVDGIVSAADLTVWRNHFPTAPQAAAMLAKVPEPAAISLIVIAFAAPVVARRSLGNRRPFC